MPTMRVVMLISGPGAMDFAKTLEGAVCPECHRPTAQGFGDVMGQDNDGNVIFSYGDVSRPNENGSPQWKIAADAFVYDVQQMAAKSEWPEVVVVLAPLNAQPMVVPQKPTPPPVSVHDEQLKKLAAAKKVEDERIAADAKRKAEVAAQMPAPTPFTPEKKPPP